MVSGNFRQITKQMQPMQKEARLIRSVMRVRETFASYFTTAESDTGIVVFENLGKDALLVVPIPQTDDSAYAHIAAFTRNGPAPQVHALWQIVGQTMQQRISNQPIWLSTEGSGVSWLHIRFDSRPKYYGFSPYREGEILQKSHNPRILKRKNRWIFKTR